MSQPRPAARTPEAGVTLVEVLVALVIFALIGAAGFTMLDQVARVERLTQGRLARLEAAQRTLRVMAVDFGQARAQGLVADPGGGVVVQRSGGGGAAAAGPVTLRYTLQDGQLYRSLIGRDGGTIAHQSLLTGITGAVWQYLDSNGDWQAEWPPADAPASVAAPPNPRAVAVTLTLAEGGSLRRVAQVPGGEAAP